MQVARDWEKQRKRWGKKSEFIWRSKLVRLRYKVYIGCKIQTNPLSNWLWGFLFRLERSFCSIHYHIKWDVSTFTDFSILTPQPVTSLRISFPAQCSDWRTPLLPIVSQLQISVDNNVNLFLFLRSRFEVYKLIELNAISFDFINVFLIVNIHWNEISFKWIDIITITWSFYFVLS